MQPFKALLNFLLSSICLMVKATPTPVPAKDSFVMPRDESDHNLIVDTYWGPDCQEENRRTNSSFAIPLNLLHNDRCIDVFEVGSVYFEENCQF
ncbi:hypothetical protein CLAFUW4_13822 [Fulvia fulva]|uniref:Uncharacterized protein n=1 Tax=Passalora fulva TaxID=5499 RepID=A0A9Q8UVQ8_PASFU|nr:uncharacterized protein CLAFUR5_13666 [Fulvia fulva]KAK4610268.1 hypothetical protein CLAFUR4_13824 [Fulvia fulva]KAK4610882.1 hypothetical protein CLAFUR0_13828 [Fulvia fulva]UJO24236.1 hypothetical protein CLAFUR5_13666 [Fulvia fulva]WPV22069.1 hypothetical protein CLAFUW4_13822 [Fulvia fulva]WPV36974.1 hypothetical protein CLAFUW7_13830 [Fulvia fulva]